MERKKKCKRRALLVGLPKVTRPPELGGLGISHLQQLGWFFRMTWLWLQKTEPDKPWASFPIQTHHSVRSFFVVAIISEIGNAINTLFWMDRWLHGQSFDKLVPHLFGAIPAERKKKNSA